MVARETRAPVKIAQLLAKLPPFSPVALRLMAIVSDEDVSFKEVTELIRLDPALAGEVLSLANSGLYGRRFPVRSVPHAMALVGIRRVASIVITAALWKALPRRSSPFIASWWRHSVATALVADHVSSAQNMDSSYTAGLLHAIGQLALYQHSPEAYTESLKFCCSAGGDFLEIEQEAFGIDHAVLGDAILEHWGLDRAIREAALLHHFESVVPDGLSGALQTACLAAECAGFGSCGSHHRIAAGDIPASVRKLIDTGYLMEVLPQEINGIESSLA